MGTHNHKDKLWCPGWMNKDKKAGQVEMGLGWVNRVLRGQDRSGIGGGGDFKVSVRVQHLVSEQLPCDPRNCGRVWGSGRTSHT